MRSVACCFLAFAIASGAILQERAFIAPRPIAPRPKSLPPPRVPTHPDNIPGRLSGSPGSGLSALPHGSAPESTIPFKEPANGNNKELIVHALETAVEIFNLLNDVVDLASAGDDNDDDNEDDNKWSPAPVTAQPRIGAGASNRASNSSANYILQQNNVTYSFTSDPRLLDKNVVTEIAETTNFNRLDPYQDLLTPQEYSMYLDDPLCFYANIETMYISAASSLASATTSPTPTQTLQRRQSSVNKDTTSCVQVVGDLQACSAVSGSPEWSTSLESSRLTLWAYELPDQLWSAHFATATAASGDVTATATSTTSCKGLNGGEGAVTSYRELKIRGAETSGVDGSEGPAVTPVGESVSAAGKERGSIGLMTLVGGVVVAVGLML